MEYFMCRLDMAPAQKSTSGNWSTMCVHAPKRNLYYWCLFSKIKQKQDDGDVFWWIFGHVSLLILEKKFEDANHYSVLQIDIISSRKYCDLTSIASNEYSTNTHTLALPVMLYFISKLFH